MSMMYGYGEDALTLWALKHHLSALLKKYKDQTDPDECLVFYRPSFGRAGGKNSSEFGEFDAIVASQEKIYLVESKWDNAGKAKNYKQIIKPVQTQRHEILSWYITHWNKKYSDKWQKFTEETSKDFKKTFKNKPLASTNSLLAENLEFILNKLHNKCKKFEGEASIRNVLLFFYTSKSKSNFKTPNHFGLLRLNHIQKYKTDNFINLN